MKRMAIIMAATALGAVTGAPAGASVLVQVWENQVAAAADATLANKPTTAPDETFSSNSINYNSNVTGYTIGAFFNNPTFVTGGANAGNTLNNTYSYITGQAYLNAGANSFTIPHDDGLELNFTGIGIVLSQPGPTSAVDSPFTVNAPTAGLYNFQLAYGETAGPPAVLEFTVNGAPVGGVPEAATWAMMIAGFGLVGVAARQRRTGLRNA